MVKRPGQLQTSLHLYHLGDGVSWAMWNLLSWDAERLGTALAPLCIFSLTHTTNILLHTSTGKLNQDLILHLPQSKLLPFPPKNVRLSIFPISVNSTSVFPVALVKFFGIIHISFSRPAHI